MPWTAACFLVGAVAISALPPFNGFVSEWMVFISLLSGFNADGMIIRFFAPILASFLGLAGALAATCFVKAFGICFLGEPRSDHTKRAKEVSGSMKFAMSMLAISCLAFGLLAPVIVFLLQKIAISFIPQADTATFISQTIFISLPGFGQVSPLILGLMLMGTLIILCMVVHSLGNEVRTGPSWDCGMPKLVPRMQYTATGYSKPIRRIFSFLYQPNRRVELEDEGNEILRTARRFDSSTIHIFEEWIYKPLERFILLVSQKAKLIQTGHIQLYLSSLTSKLR